MYSGRSFSTIAAHVPLTMTLTVFLPKPKRWATLRYSTVVAKIHSVMATLHSVDTFCLKLVFCFPMISLSCWQRYWNISWLNLKLPIQQETREVLDMCLLECHFAKTTPAITPNYGCDYNNWWSSEIEQDDFIDEIILLDFIDEMFDSTTFIKTHPRNVTNWRRWSKIYRVVFSLMILVLGRYGHVELDR